jgi:hypothetical protein
LFTGRAIGGEIKCQAGETIAVEWFPFDEIPSPLSLGHKRRIEDVISGVRGICVRQEFNLQNYPEKIGRNRLYDFRDKSGLSRQAFYQKLTEGVICDEKVKVGDV